MLIRANQDGHTVRQVLIAGAYFTGRRLWITARRNVRSVKRDLVNLWVSTRRTLWKSENDAIIRGLIYTGQLDTKKLAGHRVIALKQWTQDCQSCGRRNTFGEIQVGKCSVCLGDRE